MPRLIDADAAIGHYYVEYKKQDIYDGSQDRDWLKRCIDEAPTIEAEPVRHGRWERTSDGAARCTACKRKMNPSQYGYAFCGLCGAKMDLEEMI